MNRLRIAHAVAVATVGASVLAAAPALADPFDGDVPAPTLDSAEKTIVDGYIAKQIECTPDLSPVFQSIAWDPPGFVPSLGGSGMIADENPSLGGQFAATWTGSEWSVEYMYC